MLPSAFQGRLANQCWQLLVKIPRWTGKVPSCPHHLPRDRKPRTSWLIKAQLASKTQFPDTYLLPANLSLLGKLQSNICSFSSPFSKSVTAIHTRLLKYSSNELSVMINQQLCVFLAVDLRHDRRRKVKAHILLLLSCICSWSGTPHPKQLRFNIVINVETI